MLKQNILVLSVSGAEVHAWLFLISHAYSEVHAAFKPTLAHSWYSQKKVSLGTTHSLLITFPTSNTLQHKKCP